jgi:hypothetical protein
MNGSLPRNYGWFSQAARFRHFASRMRSILEHFEPFAANRVFEIYTWVRQIRDKSNLTFNENYSRDLRPAKWGFNGHIGQHQS